MLAVSRNSDAVQANCRQIAQAAIARLGQHEHAEDRRQMMHQGAIHDSR